MTRQITLPSYRRTKGTTPASQRAQKKLKLAPNLARDLAVKLHHGRTTANTGTSPPFVCQPNADIRVMPEATVIVLCQLRLMVRNIIEILLDDLVDAEAIAICGADKYSHSEFRRHARTGSYVRNLQTAAGTLQLRLPILRRMPYPKIVIERFRAHNASIVRQLGGMYLRGASARRLQSIVEYLWGPRPMPGQLADYGSEIAWKIESLRNKEITNLLPLHKLQLAVTNIPGAFIDDVSGHVRVWVLFEKTQSSESKVISMASMPRCGIDECESFQRWLGARGATQASQIMPADL